MKLRLILFPMLLAILTINGYSWANQPAAKLNAFVSIIPQAYFLERIGGNHINVETLVGEGQSPHTYEPSPRQMAKLSTAKLYFVIGVSFEKNLIPKIKKSHKKLIIIETQKGVTYRFIEDNNHNEQKNKTKTHSQRIPDPHIWMDPKLVKIQAKNMHDALRIIDPTNSDNYAKNLNDFISDLDKTDKRISKTLAPLKGSNMYVFHPSFGYFADSYGLNQIPIEIEGKEPTAKQLAAIIDRAKKDGVRVIFVQPQFSKKSAETIAKAIGGAVVPINPLAYDYLNNLERISSEIEKGLRRQ